MNGLRPLRLLPLLPFMLLAALLAGLALSPPALAFPDVDPSHPYAAAIDGLAARGILSGHNDGTFGPDESVARCQFAKMIVNTLGIAHDDPSTPFSDVGLGDLPEYVAAAAAHGITNGTNSAGTLFSPWGPVSRAQVLTMVVRAMDSQYPGLLGYVFGGGMMGGWGLFDPTHARNASTAWGNNLLFGLPEMASLDPWAPMPRGEVAQVLWNALNPIDRAARVTEVVDGDTVLADYKGKNETIELLGIDAPELDEPLGPEAKDRLASMVANGRFLRLQFDVVTRDEDGHLLAYVLFDGFPGWWIANQELLRVGLAQLHLVPPNLKYADELRSAQDSAKEQHLGIWNPNPGSPLEILSVHPDAAGDDNGNLNDEWIEFRVTMGGPLTGYTVQNEAGQRYNFAADRGHWPGEVFKLRTGSGTDEIDLHWGAGSEIWNNDKDTVFVVDPAGRVVAERSWGASQGRRAKATDEHEAMGLEGERSEISPSAALNHAASWLRRRVICVDPPPLAKLPAGSVEGHSLAYLLVDIDADDDHVTLSLLVATSEVSGHTRLPDSPHQTVIESHVRDVYDGVPG